jgi:hypothetical protein
MRHSCTAMTKATKDAATWFRPANIANVRLLCIGLIVIFAGIIRSCLDLHTVSQLGNI